MTERLAERPRLQQAGDGRERDGQQAHDDVGHGQIGDEYVGNGLHGAPGRHDVDHQAVAGDAEHEDDDVQRDEDDAQPRPLHHVVVVVVDDAEVTRRHELLLRREDDADISHDSVKSRRRDCDVAVDAEVT